jgi:hypothetical protein
MLLSLNRLGAKWDHSGNYMRFDQRTSRKTYLQLPSIDLGVAIMSEVRKIGIDDLFEAAAAGVLRGMQAREISAERLVASGFAVRVDLIAGRWLAVQLNPQPLPPGVAGPGAAGPGIAGK